METFRVRYTYSGGYFEEYVKADYFEITRDTVVFVAKMNPVACFCAPLSVVKVPESLVPKEGA